MLPLFPGLPLPLLAEFYSWQHFKAISFFRTSYITTPFSLLGTLQAKREKQHILLKMIKHTVTHCVKPACPDICYSEASAWSLLLSFFICSIKCSKCAERSCIIDKKQREKWEWRPGNKAKINIKLAETHKSTYIHTTQYAHDEV